MNMGKTQNWLIEQVAKKTELYFDDSYLWKIMYTEECRPAKIVSAIKEILELEDEQA